MSAYRFGKGMELGGGAYIVDMATFGLVGELEIRKALRLQYPVAIVVIRPGPSLEEDERHLLERVARLVSLLVRQSDLVSVSSTRRPALYVLLVDALPGDLEVIMARIRHEVHRHRISGPGDGERVRISLGAACFPSTATTWRDLIREADHAARNGQLTTDAGVRLVMLMGSCEAHETASRERRRSRERSGRRRRPAFGAVLAAARR